ncbi:MarR family winged helix-turn-helix transcriptional regulator [Cryptosporangium phraense]|uniref:MarR family winged helix-turn-helix transcriptional regulator n=1 Tax=Cryptosporangium phraense TaxID=2593070 RepID=UPI00147981A7|nr:MarR family transcriptional regulator [Cryptosporangium phraense]
MNDDDVRVLRQQVNALQRRLRRETSGGPISRTARQVLFAIHRANAPITPGELTTELQMTSSNVAASLRELDAAHYITRDRDTGDGRRILLRTTPTGADAVEEHRRGKDAWLADAINATLTPDEQRELQHAGILLQRLADRP